MFCLVHFNTNAYHEQNALRRSGQKASQAITSYKLHMIHALFGFFIMCVSCIYSTPRTEFRIIIWIIESNIKVSKLLIERYNKYEVETVLLEPLTAYATAIGSQSPPVDLSCLVKGCNLLSFPSGFFCM